MRTGTPCGRPLTVQQGLVEELGSVGLGVLPEAGERRRVLGHVGGRDERRPEDGAVRPVGTRQQGSDEEATHGRHGEQRGGRDRPGRAAGAVLQGGPVAVAAQRGPADGDEGEDGALEQRRRGRQRAEHDRGDEEHHRGDERRHGTGPAARDSSAGSQRHRRARRGTAGPCRDPRSRRGRALSAAPSSRALPCARASRTSAPTG